MARTRHIVYDAKFKGFDRALARVEKLGATADKAEMALARLAVREKRLADESGKLSRAARTATAEVNSFAAAMTGAGRSAETGGQKIGRSATKFTELNSAAELADKGIRAVQRAFDALEAPANLSIDFERQFNMIRTLSDEVGDDLRSGLLDLASRVPQTAGDITQAAYQAISAGIDPPDVVGFMTAASDVAVAANSDLTTAVTLLTTAVNSFENQGLTAAEAADVVFKTVEKGVTTIPELSSTLGMVAAQASDAGFSFAELGAAIATITKKQGGLTSEAITQVRSLTTALTAPKREADVYKAIGLEAGFAATRANGLAATLKDLEEKANASGVEIGAMFGRVEAGAAALKLTGDGAESFAEALAATEDAAGATERALSKVEGDAQFLLDSFKALGEHILREMANKALPHLKEGLEEILKVMEEDGPAMVEAFGEAVDVLVDLGRWVAQNGPELIEFVVTFFAASRVTAFAAAINTDLVAAVTRLGAGGGIAGALKMALRSPGVVGAVVAGSYFLGKTMAETVFEVWDAEAHRNMERYKAELIEQTKSFAAELKEIGFNSIGEAEQARSDVDQGKALGFGQSLKADGFGQTPREFYDAALKEMGDQGKAFDATMAIVDQDVAARQAQIQKLEEQRVEAMQEYDAARLASSVQFKARNESEGDRLLQKANDALEVANRLKEDQAALAQSAQAIRDAAAGWGDDAPAPRTGGISGRQAVDRARGQGADEKQRQRAAERAAKERLRLARDVEDRQAALIADAHKREVAETEIRHAREMERAGAAGADVLELRAVQIAELDAMRARHADEEAAEALARDRRQTDFIADETDRRIELLQIEMEERLRLARQTGESEAAIQGHYQNKITKAVQDGEKARRAAMVKDIQAVTGSIQASLGAVDGFMEAFGAGEKARAGIKVGVNLAQSVEEGAKSYAAFASGNAGSGVAHAAAAAGHVAAAIQWGKVAGGGGGGASAGGGGAGGGGGAARNTDRQTLRAGQPDQGAGAPVEQTIVMQFGGQPLHTVREIENTVGERLGALSNRTGRPQYRLNRVSRASR